MQFSYFFCFSLHNIEIYIKINIKDYIINAITGVREAGEVTMKLGIRGKMLLGILIPAVSILLLAGVLIGASVGNYVTKQTREKLAADSQSASNETDTFFTGHLKAVEQSAQENVIIDFLRDLKGVQRADDAPGYRNIMEVLSYRQALDTASILGVFLGDIDSSQLFQLDGFVSEVGWDITARPWFETTKTKKPLMTEPYVDASTGQTIVTAAAPVIDHKTGEVYGAAGTDIRLDTLQNKINEVKLGKSGFLVLISEKGNILCHPNGNDVGKSIGEIEISDEVKAGVQNAQTGNYIYQMEGKTYYGSLTRVNSVGWYVLSAMPEAEALEGYHRVVDLTAVIFAAGMILLAAAVLLISQGITRPLKRLAAAADKIADGELNVEIGVSTKDESGQVASAMDRTVKRLKEYIGYINEVTAVLDQIGQGNLQFQLERVYEGDFAKIRDALMGIRSVLSETLGHISRSAGQVTMSSGHIADSAQSLAGGNSEQASSVEELSATINELFSHVEANTRRTEAVNQRSVEMGGQLNQSNSQMQELLEAVGEISSKSGEIGKIIKTIEDIAFQTNILALNAAVEAARAGEAGKGFAVVADEVRNLANKSGDAAKNTTVLIEESLKAIDHGRRIADEAARSLNQVVEGAEEIVNAVDAISKASEEQAESLGQVRTGVDQIAEVVQTNSAMAEKNAAAGEELSAEAKVLFDLISKFRVDDADR